MTFARVGTIGACAVCATVVSYAQIGKIVQQDWVTGRGDAQRTSWIRGDAAISTESMQKPGFTLQWKATLDNQPRQLNALNAGVVMGNLGFGSIPLSFITGSANRVFAVDNDTGALFWQRTFDSGGGRAETLECPGGITSAATRPASAVPTIPGPARGPQTRPAYTSGVGAPGEGVPAYLMGRGRAAAAPAPAAAARGPAPPQTPPPAPPPPVVYALSSDGQLHTLGLYTGKDVARPLTFLPPNARASDLIALNNIVYTTTMRGCSGVADGVWALDLTRDGNAVKTWKTDGGSPTGPPAFRSDGTLVVAIGARAASGAGGYANAMVALNPQDLTVTDWFTQPDVDFVTPPAILKVADREVVAAAARDGSIVLLDATSLGGSTHDALLARSATVTGERSGFVPTGLSTWVDSSGTSWVLMPTATAVAAMKISISNGTPTIASGWVSRQMRAPLSPVIVNGVAFVVSSGEFVPPAGASVTAADRARRSVPAVLYALDAVTGRELWSSGTTIATFARGSATWPGIGQIHVATYDNTVFAFGFPVERY